MHHPAGMTESVGSYYSDSDVRQRMLDYLGTARFIVDHTPPEPQDLRSPEALGDLLARGGELHRSLWDRCGLMVDLNIDYVHFEDPLRPYRDPYRCFQLQQGVVDTLQSMLQQYAIPPLHLLSGRGHHFNWMIPASSEAFQQLALLGQVSAPGPADSRVGREEALAFSGLGMVLEYLGHQLLRRAARNRALPIRLAPLRFLPGDSGQEMICLDLSPFAEPLQRGYARLPFSLYRTAEKWGCPNRILCLPCGELDWNRLLGCRGDLGACRQWAGQALTNIPDGSSGMLNLLRAYRLSELAALHRDFYAQLVAEREFPGTCRDTLPTCLRCFLSEPSEELLQPGSLQNLVRLLLLQGWPSGEITRLVCARLEQEPVRRTDACLQEAACRAEFYTRLFGGLLKTGLDRLVGFACPSTRGKGSCGSDCRFSLPRLAASWLRRHIYD